MTDTEVIQFVEWVLKISNPEYDMDTRYRFTPQIVLKGEPFLWIETKKFSRTNPKFYTTQQVLEIYKQTKHETD